jgi:Gram-negative bacterial TonB protein C-terminal
MNTSARRFLGTLLYFVSLPALAQTAQPAAPSPAPTDPAAISAKAHSVLEDGIRTNGLTASDWKPWHMKATFQLYDQGVVSQEGTIEEWASGPYQWRRTYTTKTQSATEWSVTRGRRFQSRGIFDFSILDMRVATPLITPLLQAVTFKPDYTMDWKQFNTGAVLNCVTVVKPEQYAGKGNPDFMFPRLCFDSGSRLRLLGTSNSLTSYNKYEVFHDRAIASKIDATFMTQKSATIEITLLEALADQDHSQLQPPSNAVPQPYPLTDLDPRPVAVHQEAADLPAAAMKSQSFGTIVVPVLIQKNGHIKINGDTWGDPLLVQSAKDAIVRWRYEPYSIDGEVVEVTTTLKYVFDAKPFVPDTGANPKSGR